MGFRDAAAVERMVLLADQTGAGVLNNSTDVDATGVVRTPEQGVSSKVPPGGREARQWRRRARDKKHHRGPAGSRDGESSQFRDFYSVMTEDWLLFAASPLVEGPRQGPVEKEPSEPRNPATACLAASRISPPPRLAGREGVCVRCLDQGATRSLFPGNPPRSPPQLEPAALPPGVTTPVGLWPCLGFDRGNAQELGRVGVSCESRCEFLPFTEL